MIKNWDNIPECCKMCWNLSSEHIEPYNDINYYCKDNIILPTKKQSCTRCWTYSNITEKTR